MTSKYLNLGYGSRFHPAWTSVNFTKSDEIVIAANLVEWLVCLISRKAAFRGFRMGVFKDSGEVYQWMYGSYSLKRLLDQAGFVKVKTCAANESCIPEYEKYSLDVINGRSRKPDLIYIEASKP